MKPHTSIGIIGGQLSVGRTTLTAAITTALANAQQYFPEQPQPKEFLFKINTDHVDLDYLPPTKEFIRDSRRSRSAQARRYDPDREKTKHDLERLAEAQARRERRASKQKGKDQ